MRKPGFLENIRLNGLTYDQYVQKTDEDSEKKIPEGASDIEINRHSVLKLNIQRMKRIDKTYIVSDKMLEALRSIDQKQLWMIISEPWCGDSAQIVPQLQKIASENSLIDLKILLRDKNLGIMDLYLNKDKKRSIPVLVAFDENGEELFKWGSRPAVAENLVKELKSQGLSSDEFGVKLHLWYAQNKGLEIEKELLTLLEQSTVSH